MAKLEQVYIVYTGIVSEGEVKCASPLVSDPTLRGLHSTLYIRGGGREEQETGKSMTVELFNI